MRRLLNLRDIWKLAGCGRRERGSGANGRPLSECQIRSCQYPGRCLWWAKATMRISSSSSLYTTMYGKRWRRTLRVPLWNGDPRLGLALMKSG